MGIKVVTLIVISLIYLIWNVLNEVAVNMFWNTNDTKYVRDWHKYDALLRVILFPLVVFTAFGISVEAIKIVLVVGILYRPLFNLSFNYWRNKETFKRLTSKEKINVLLYLSKYSSIDNALIEANNWLFKKIDQLSRWLHKITWNEKKQRSWIQIQFNVKFQYLNLILIILEILLVTAIIIWM